MEQKLIGGIRRPQPSAPVQRRRHDDDPGDRDGRRQRWQEAVAQSRDGGQTDDHKASPPVVNRAPAGLPPLAMMLTQVAETAPAPDSLTDDQKRILLRFRRDLRQAFGQLGLDRLASPVALEHAVTTAAARLSAESAVTTEMMAAVYRLADTLKDPAAARALLQGNPRDDDTDPADGASR